jgi:hypothetical protein
MPTAVSTLLETPINGHIPRNFARTILLMNTADMIRIIYYIL